MAHMEVEALRLGWQSQLCSYCHGSGVLAYDDPNGANASSRELCPCGRSHREWVRQDGLGLKNDAEMQALILHDREQRIPPS